MSMDFFVDKFYPNRKVDVMRVDIEGPECSVIKGSKKIIEANPDIIIAFEW